MRVFASVDDLARAVGESLGPGDWLPVDQHRVDMFAEATDDHQWIHTDPQRAADGPYGGTVAHGFLTVSLVPALMRRLYRVDGVRARINYGLDRVRFPAPLRTGSAVRAEAAIASVEPVVGGVQAVMAVTLTADSGDRPVCVAETISRLLVTAPR
ncbi:MULTISPECIES: MaoC family dehydratase [unclassified Solwaraspora]|uniref:MaoC family dehydratase n=1 Tax=unclassified Solwaraspora TaxID=2627926 RepID=UPI00248C76A2|nr:MULTISPECIES: MaoC family dehydratase [unclassified Solwaraspora]WBB98611.1 MaoC family dehydratase [Solwaraspora sp. WMMA2059]WBC22837.1 MaoC family dehydratase [Solwaraspora sp. WMMA2080]WJK35122.1 MaoC family dehydratase [Solwaraspora sp. WMMA2065]